MHASTATNDEWSALPLMLTVEEAGRVLRIGRTHAYGLTTRYFESDGVEGIPVLRLGGVLRVPKAALLELVTTGRIAKLLASAEPTTAPTSVPSETTPVRHRSDGAQLTLFPES